jgi:hypothetical protein
MPEPDRLGGDDQRDGPGRGGERLAGPRDRTAVVALDAHGEHRTAGAHHRAGTHAGVERGAVERRRIVADAVTRAPRARSRQQSTFGATNSSSIAPRLRALGSTLTGQPLRCPMADGNAGGFATAVVTSSPTIDAIRLSWPSAVITGA